MLRCPPLIPAPYPRSALAPYLPIRVSAKLSSAAPTRCCTTTRAFHEARAARPLAQDAARQARPPEPPPHHGHLVRPAVPSTPYVALGYTRASAQPPARAPQSNGQQALHGDAEIRLQPPGCNQGCVTQRTRAHRLHRGVPMQHPRAGGRRQGARGQGCEGEGGARAGAYASDLEGGEGTPCCSRSPPRRAAADPPRDPARLHLRACFWHYHVDAAVRGELPAQERHHAPRH